MTSETLRKLLVAGAAVAALSVGACSKPAENTTTTNTETTTVAPADANTTTTENTTTTTTTNAG